MTKRTKILYAIGAFSLFCVFLLIFARNLPGGENPVIAKQPEVSMGSIKADAVLKPDIGLRGDVRGRRVPTAEPIAAKRRTSLTRSDIASGKRSAPTSKPSAPNAATVPSPCCARAARS